jgi:hypothetical protein
LVDNTQTLGASNAGGFSVFGRVVSGADQRVINTLAAASVVDESKFNSAFNTLPLNNYSGTKFPTDTTAANYDLINSITIVQQTQQLTYSILSNSDTSGAIVTPTISFGQLDLHPVGEGVATIVVKATDRSGQSANITFTVKVGPVIITNPGNQTNLDGDTVNLPITASDTNNKTLTFSASNLPTGLTINPTTGTITGTLAATAHKASPYTTTITAIDGISTASQAFTWTVNPVVTISTIGNQTNVEGDSVNVQVSAKDAKNLPLTYSAVFLPTGLSINSSTGLISGKVASGAHSNSPFAVDVTVSDGTNTASQAFSWTIGA